MSERLQLRQARRLVVKIGSALLTNDGKGLDVAALGLWVDQIAELIAEGVEVVVVSSGSVAEGMSRLGWTVRPQHLHELQAAAAVGQMGLVQTWEAQFKRHDIHTAQPRPSETGNTRPHPRSPPKRQTLRIRPSRTL